MDDIYQLGQVIKILKEIILECRWQEGIRMKLSEGTEYENICFP